jgi:D-alanine-D-alanine ligase
MITTINVPPEWLTTSIRYGEMLSDEVGVVLVANVKGRTKPIDDYEGDSIITEFLSATELDDIVSYFEDAGLYCEALIDEDGFLKWLTEERHRFPRRYPIVYNLAQNGTGPGRLTVVAGLCRLYGIPTVDSDAYTVAIAQHKFHALSLLSHFGLPVARCWSFTKQGWWPEPPPDGLRLLAKPSFESASIGISDESVFEMGSAVGEKLMRLVASYRQPLTVQEFIVGFEIEVPVFEAGGPQTLTTIGIELNGQRDLADRFLTYEQVFSDGYAFYNFADESASVAEEAMTIARRAFYGLGLNGIGRVDFRIGTDGRPLIMEANCKPHVTKHSGFISALRTVGCSGSDLAKFLVGSTAERYKLRD